MELVKCQCSYKMCVIFSVQLPFQSFFFSPPKGVAIEMRTEMLVDFSIGLSSYCCGVCLVGDRTTAVTVSVLLFDCNENWYASTNFSKIPGHKNPTVLEFLRASRRTDVAKLIDIFLTYFSRFETSSGKNWSPDFLNSTRTAYKTFPTILLLLVYSSPR
jgi:hypothetical protein